MAILTCLFLLALIGELGVIVIVLRMADSLFEAMVMLFAALMVTLFVVWCASGMLGGVA